MKASIGILAILAFTLNVQAEIPVLKAPSHTGVEAAEGHALPDGPFVAPAAGNNCANVEDGGQFPTGGPYAYTGWSTCGAGNDFEGPATFPGCSYGAGGEDQVVQFTVATSGFWNFWTCGYAYFDTSLAVYADGGAGCPTTQAAWDAQAVACDGDSCNNTYYESDMYATLYDDETYYLVLDGWSPGTCATTAWVVFYMTGVLCTSDASCIDDLFCNGTETCNLGTGMCEAGDFPCEAYQTCEEPDQCIDPDPCLVYNQSPQDSSYFGPYKTYGYVRGWTDITLREGAGRELVSYQICISGRADATQPEPTGPFDITSMLWTVEPTGGTVNGEPYYALPLAPIPGTLCTFTQSPDPGGTPCQPHICVPSEPVTLPNTEYDEIPATENSIDLFLGIEAGPNGMTGGGSSLVPPNVGYNPWFYLFPETGGYQLVELDTGGLGFLSWSGGVTNVQAFAETNICTVVAGPCCYETGCDYVDAASCTGTYGGDNTLPAPILCMDPDGDDVFSFGDGTTVDADGCDNCPDVANPLQADCNGDDEGDACEAAWEEQDDDDDGECNGTDGCPDDPYKIAPGACGCGYGDSDPDGDQCYVAAGEPSVICSPHDYCPTDGNKCDPGCCGCGFTDTDVDGDGFFECAPDATPADPSCVDTCPDVDDNVFGPCPDDVIPTVSEWGLVILALLLLAAGKVYFGRRKAMG